MILPPLVFPGFYRKQRERDPKKLFGRVFNFKLGRFGSHQRNCMRGKHGATSKLGTGFFCWWKIDKKKGLSNR